MWFYIFAGTCIWGGALLLIGACCGKSDELAEDDQIGRYPTKWVSRVGLFFIVLGLVFAFGGPAKAQMVMWPGQELQFCNGIGAITGGGTVCKHDIYEQRIVINHRSYMEFDTFWGTGTAASLLPPLCRISNVHSVTETVFAPGMVRIRHTPCNTGKSGEWVVIRGNKK